MPSDCDFTPPRQTQAYVAYYNTTRARAMRPVALPAVLSSYLFKISWTSAEHGSRLSANASQEHDTKSELMRSRI